MSAADLFRDDLRSGRFLITAELESPRNSSSTNVRRQARAMAPFVDAIDCTDNSAAIVRMNPTAALALAAPHVRTCLIQLTCRDRNRIALQSELLGAAALGAAGAVCIGGDPPEAGNHPDAKAVYDLSTPELIGIVRGFAGGRFQSGDLLDPAVDLVAGCVENPADGEASIERLAAKVEAGAEFVQTQICFDLDQLEQWLALLKREGLGERVRVLAGIAPIRRPAVARYLTEHVRGVTIPAHLIKRLEGAADAESEGVRIAAELLNAARRLPGLGGAHLLTFGWADGVAKVVEASTGLAR
jgi:methylenetetrahydrofolate reductase (NADH)